MTGILYNSTYSILLQNENSINPSDYLKQSDGRKKN